MKRLNFVTLGVRNLEKSRKFYTGLFGWKPAKFSNKDVVFFDMGGYVLSLFPRAHLAKDAQVPSAGKGFSGITLAHNVATKREVAAFLKKAVKHGAKIKKPAQDVFWGGHSGYFADPNGHLWEIAWNPFIPVQKDGKLKFK